jgi:Ca2+-binding RTX toxin-like protein
MSRSSRNSLEFDIEVDSFKAEPRFSSLSQLEQNTALMTEPPPPQTGPDVVVTAPGLSLSQGGLIGYLYLGGGNQSGGGGTVMGGWKPNNPPPQPNPREIAVSQAIDNLREHGKLTESDIARMDALGIKLSEVLRPGIYQAEFDVVQGGILGTVGEHREWVRVFADGHTELLTAGASPNGELDIRLTSFEEDAHGLKLSSGEIRFFAVAPTIENSQLATERWSLMVQEGAEQDARHLNYHFLAQNSNSAFNTIGLAGKIVDREDGGNWAAASGVDLNDVDAALQPEKLTGGSNSISGTAGNDNLAGNIGDTILYGYEGDDHIYAYSVGDYIEGGTGNDIIDLVGGVARGGVGSDTITATGSASVSLYGNNDTDTLRGGSAGDVLDGGLGDDHVYGGAGNDQIEGGDGGDILLGEAGDDVIIGGLNNDGILGGDGNDVVMGEYGDDNLDGGDGDDGLSGAAGRDTIKGGNGNDYIRGGPLADQLWGGAGSDTFAINYNGYVGIGTSDSYVMHRPMSDGGTIYEFDTIHDFEPGIDKIDISEFNQYSGPDLTTANITISQRTDGTFVGWMLPNHGAYGYDGEVFLAGAFGVTVNDFII